MMANTRRNNATAGISGKVDQFVFRQWFGRTLVGKLPLTRGTATAGQLSIRSTFKEAVIYAKAALTDPATKAAYRAKTKPGQTPYNMAVADFFNPPVIGDIDTSNYGNQAGSHIRVPVTDDFRVMSVKVKIEKANGTLVEEGDGILTSNGLHWQYDATVLGGTTTGNSITVTATDLPGHAITKQKTV